MLIEFQHFKNQLVMLKLISFLILDGYTKYGIWHRTNILKNFFIWLKYILSSKISDDEKIYIEPDVKIVLDNNYLILFWGYNVREFSRNR